MADWNQAEPLADATNGTKSTGPPQNETMLKAAREAGWAERTPYKYDDADNNDHADQPLWAHKKGRYEWKEEYGDVGPEVPQLEKELFHDEFINRQGLKFDKYATHPYGTDKD